MGLLAARRASRYPALQAKLQYLALPLAPLVQVNTGRVHSAFPLSMLQFWLLTDSQLDSLAHFYHQRTPGRWSQRYPCPVAWPAGLTLEEKRRKLGKFIGLRGCETPVAAVASGPSECDTTGASVAACGESHLWNTTSAQRALNGLLSSDAPDDVVMTDADSNDPGYGSEPSCSPPSQWPQRTSTARRRSPSPIGRGRSSSPGSTWRDEQNARIAARSARLSRPTSSRRPSPQRLSARRRRNVRTVQQREEPEPFSLSLLLPASWQSRPRQQQHEQQQPPHEQQLQRQQPQQQQQQQQQRLPHQSRRIMTVEDVIEEARRAQLEYDSHDGALRRKLGQFD